MLNLPLKLFSIKNNFNKKYNFIFFKKKIIDFFLLDGPPFANGEFHIGHILNKTIKNILINIVYLKNKILLYNLGWDCHGLPIEQLNTIDNLFFLNCRKFVCNNIFLQKQNLNNFELLKNNNTYNTMHPFYESYQYNFFNILLLKNIILSKKIPILWCYKCSSSLSYSEIIYKKAKYFSYYIKIKLNNYYIVIWTTTLWSIINNQSIFFTFKNIYIKFKSKKCNLLFSNFLFYKIINIFKIKGKIISFYIGYYFYYKKYFIFLKNILLYYNIKNNFINNNFIDYNIGTGFVHCAPSNGVEDYNLFSKKILNFFSKKYFIKFLKIFKKINLFYFIKIIFKLLKKRKIFKIEKIIHNNMYCWRHKKPIFYYLSKQIFINLNFCFKKKNIKNYLLKSIKKIKFYPIFIKKNLSKMIINRSNWCISRQRYWGVPIELNFYKNSFYKNLSKNLSSHFFFYITNKNNIFDVWFDSSIITLLIKNSKIIIEGKDQIRGWYQSIIFIIFFCNFNINIYKIISHNFCVDKFGNKLSKSSKNYKKINDILKINNKDVVKLYLIEHDFKKNILFEINNIKNSIFTFIIIKNFIKFLVNNFYNFNFIYNNILTIDYYILKKTKKIYDIIINLITNFNFYNSIKIIKLFINFINLNYFNHLKFNLYINKTFSYVRNSCLITIYNLLFFIKNIIFPILNFNSNNLFFFFNYFKLTNVKNSFSHFFKLKKIIKKNFFFFKKNNNLKKIKKNSYFFFSENIFFYNFFWNWIEKKFFFKNNTFKKKCYLSKNYICYKKYILKKKMCNKCLLNFFHNYEEIKFYV